jgi:riboflavin kinase/FMN adenylyltransferase
VVGKNFNFGKGNSNDFDIMEKYCHLTIVPLKEVNGRTISSTMINEMIDTNDIADIPKALGFNYIVEGNVVVGEGKAKKLGFPTANIEVIDNTKLPNDGTFATYITIDNVRYKSMTYYGRDMSKENSNLKLETNIFDFDGELHGKIVYLEFIEYISPPEVLNSKELLIKKLQKDEIKARKVLD